VIITFSTNQEAMASDKIYCHRENKKFPSSEFELVNGYYVHTKGVHHWAQSGGPVGPVDDPPNTASRVDSAIKKKKNLKP